MVFQGLSRIMLRDGDCNARRIRWSDEHSPVGCTVREAAGNTLIVRTAWGRPVNRMLVLKIGFLNPHYLKPS
jgi:hypothetical protein